MNLESRDEIESMRAVFSIVFLLIFLGSVLATHSPEMAAGACIGVAWEIFSERLLDLVLEERDP